MIEEFLYRNWADSKKLLKEVLFKLNSKQKKRLSENTCTDTVKEHH